MFAYHDGVEEPSPAQIDSTCAADHSHKAMIVTGLSRKAQATCNEAAGNPQPNHKEDGDSATPAQLTSIECVTNVQR